jgi:DNA polymerase-3 subunit delta'
LSLLHANDEEHPFEQWFVTWVRAAFKQKKMLRIHDLILWSEK